MLSRRSFLKGGLTSGALVLPLEPGASDAGVGRAPGTNGPPPPALVAMPARLAPEEPASRPWQHGVRRVGQTNMTEHDPAVMDVEAWADLWHSLEADVVYVSVTGILAFYPSRVPFHRPGRYLKGRDFFGECAAAARRRGMRVVARMSPDLNWREALEAHPEWAMRHRDGSVQFSGEEPRLFRSCMFSTYMDDYIPAIIREVNSLYEVDCFYANGWPPLGSLPECYCGVCRRLPGPGTPAYWRAFTDRVAELWQRYDGLAKERRPDSFFFANSGGNVRGGPNLDRLGRLAAWFQGDNQGRTYEEPEIWGASLQGRVASAVMDGKVAVNVTAAYSTGNPGWRNVSKNPGEILTWLSQTVASGMVPYLHFVGAEGGRGEDQRWHEAGREFFAWTARHDPHLVPRRSIADIGVVFGQATQLLYPGPGPEPGPSPHSGPRSGPGPRRTAGYMRETTQGIYDALLRGRFAFDLVHEDRLDPGSIGRYRALLLPNVAMLSDRQCRQLADYVQAGGSLMASFETGLYDEELRPRAESGLAELFGISRAGEVIGTNGNPCMMRIEAGDPAARAAILEGFAATGWLAGAENRLPLRPIADPLFTVVPGFVRYPPELAYPPVSHTSEPGLVLRERGSSRLAWSPGDIERTYWVTGHEDLLGLLVNTIRWVTRDRRQLAVEGPGLIELFGWETGPGYAIHLLNYTSPNAHHPLLHEILPLGPQRVRMQLPPGVRVRSVDLLRAGTTVPFHLEEQALGFTVPSLGEYEVAAVTVA